MKRLFAIFILLILSSLSLVQAQNFYSPLIIDIDGDYYVWKSLGSDLYPITNSGGYNRLPQLSPDNVYLAFSTVAPLAVEVLRREGGFGGGGELPTDIHLLNIETEQEMVIAAQPPDASFFTEGTPDRYMVRGTPAWSPDSRQLVWAEYDERYEQQSIVIYDVATGAFSTITQVPFPGMSIPNPVDVTWGKTSGIIVQSLAPRSGAPSDELPIVTYTVFTQSGQEFNQIQPSATRDHYVLADLLVMYNDQEYLAVQYNTGEWELIDLLNGQSQPLPGVLELVSAANPDASLRVWPTGGNKGSNWWNIMSPDGNILVGPLFASYDVNQGIGLPPNGTSVAYLPLQEQGGPVEYIEVLTDNQVDRIPIPAGKQSAITLVWSPPLWRVNDSQVADIPSPVFDCPGSQLSPRLVIGSQGRVTLGGGPNRLRVEPNTTTLQLGLIPEGGVFSVVRGPVCSDGVVWWQVNYNGVIGWTAEGQGTTYFVEPVG